MNRREFLAGSSALAVTGQPQVPEASAALAKGPVIVEAGRRVDAPGAEVPRFPPSNVSAVRKRIEKLLRKHSPAAVVCSAACGTDLLLLELAGKMHIDQLVLLPAEPDLFRKSSVTDRPGNWGELYDQVLKVARVEVLHLPEGQEGYLETNVRLLDRASQLAHENRVSAEALVVWNGTSRGPDDVTAHFLEQAKARDMATLEISTL